DSLDRRRDDYQRRIVDFLEDLALDIQENALLRDELVMNVALLIQRAREGDLTRQVQGLDELFHDEINFRIIGPLPPYSFSTVEVAKPNAEKIQEARELLGLEALVCEDDVRQAYRKLVAASHPDVNPDDPGAEERVNRLHEASTLLTEYCRAQSNGDRGTDKVRVSLLPEAVARNFMISIKRTAPKMA
ncbi:MAG: GvpL/GvpF family gas vesicle protein, partial [Dehalococcoidia bacterium]